MQIHQEKTKNMPKIYHHLQVPPNSPNARCCCKKKKNINRIKPNNKCDFRGFSKTKIMDKRFELVVPKGITRDAPSQ
jgi:hypothetical protein